MSLRHQRSVLFTPPVTLSVLHGLMWTDEKYLFAHLRLDALVSDDSGKIETNVLLSTRGVDCFAEIQPGPAIPEILLVSTMASCLRCRNHPHGQWPSVSVHGRVRALCRGAHTSPSWEVPGLDFSGPLGRCETGMESRCLVLDAEGQGRGFYFFGKRRPLGKPEEAKARGLCHM